MNEIRKSVFSRLCSVSRATIGELCAKGETLEVSPSGKIDLDIPKNLAYLMKHNPVEAARIASGGKGASTSDGSSAVEKKQAPTPQSKQPATKAQKKPRVDSTIGAMNRRQEDEVDGEDSEGGYDVPESKIDKAIKSGAFTQEEIREMLRKPLHDSNKAKAEAELKAVALDKEHGSLGELEMFDSFITELWQSIQRNMLDVITKQSALVCKRLGTVGKELEVMDVLEEDMKKRMDNVASEVQTILKGKLSRRITEVAVE